MPADTLVYVPFTPDMLPLVRGLDYGDESFQQELAFWMDNDAIPAHARGTKIWLYRNLLGEFIGYSSLGTTRWHYPTPACSRISLVVVPAVAIRRPFWGKPEGSQVDRYSSQIMRHLLKEAEAWPTVLSSVNKSDLWGQEKRRARRLSPNQGIGVGSSASC